MQAFYVDERGHRSVPEPLLGNFEYGIIKRKVRQIIGRVGYTPQDREDLEQELLARLIQALKLFDPAISHRKSFVTAVVERAVANLLRDAQAAKRDHRGIGSLNVTIEVTAEGITELAETIGDREYNARRSRHPRSAGELAQLASDLAEVLAGLPDELRHLAQRLKREPVAVIARAVGVPRTTLNETIRHLRRRFETAGLRDYL